ncbi:MAG: hypothetical protein IPH52_15585 [Leptospiraceae bacterium]|nr:hypothetical protein [Leptospiraceae bacterium]
MNVFQITDAKDREVLKSLLKEKDSCRFCSSRKLFRILEKVNQKIGIIQFKPEMTGDMTNPMYLVGVTLVILEMESFAYKIAKVKKFIQYNETFSGSSGTKNDFEMAVPGLIVFSIIMLFVHSMTFIRKLKSAPFKDSTSSYFYFFEYLLNWTGAIFNWVSLLV